MRIYCDTDTLFSNVLNQADAETNLAALEEIIVMHKRGRISACRSKVGLRELMAIKKNFDKRQQLLRDYEELDAITDDERVLGFDTQLDPSCDIANPLVSDVQDEQICTELVQRGLTRMDAHHITQAVCNGCDVFLTRDRKTIIRPRRNWLEHRFGNLKVRTPAELVDDTDLWNKQNAPP